MFIPCTACARVLRRCSILQMDSLTSHAKGHIRTSMSRNIAQRILTIISVGLFLAGLAGAILHAAADVAVWLRWIAIGVFIPVAMRRRSLLVWTFFAMVAGAELGADLPKIAAQTHVVGEIFLRLIRMIVAPLIFGGIVTGIAGHGDLRGVGRAAVKAIIYFEVVTTIGLIIGLVAMNVSQVGVGVTLPATEAAAPAVRQEGWQQIVLNIFPENIAQAVAQNQILQVSVFALLFGIALATLPEPRANAVGHRVAVVNRHDVPPYADHYVYRAGRGGRRHGLHRGQHGPGRAASAC